MWKKYYIYKEQISYDGGSTWEYTGNETISGDPIAEYSTEEECLSNVIKAILTLNDSTTVEIPGSGALISAETRAYSATTISVQLTSACTSIGVYAFYGFSGLTNVTIPSGITSIGGWAFSGCTGLNYITMEATTPPILGTDVFVDTNNCPIYVPCDSVEAYKTATTWIDYADRITCVAPVFDGKARLTLRDGSTVIIPGSGELTSGETNPYSGSNVVAVEIGSACTSVGNNAFNRVGFYSNITSLTISDTVTSIGQIAFPQLSITSLTIPSSVTYIGTGAFGHCSGLTSLVIPNSVTDMGGSVFYYCSAITSVTISISLTNIPDSILDSCYALTYVEIPSGVTSIDSNAFHKCISLTSVTIPNSVTTIDVGAFKECSALTSVNIPNSVTLIESFAFSGAGLTSVTIPSGVTSIGNNAFNDCRGLTSITINRATPPSIGSSTFAYTNNCPIYVPAASVSAYKTATNWDNYKSRIVPIP